MLVYRCLHDNLPKLVSPLPQSLLFLGMALQSFQGEIQFSLASPLYMGGIHVIKLLQEKNKK